MFEKLIRHHGSEGRCLLKGNLKRPITNESRAENCRVGYSNLLVLDIDGITLPNHTNPKTFTSKDVSTLAKAVMRELPPAVQDCSFVAQARKPWLKR